MKTDAIKAAFPYIATHTRAWVDSYCVGSAALQYYGIVCPNFPSPKELAQGLLRINPNLEAPSDVAEQITSSNDLGDFDHAWELLEQALA